MITFSEKSQRSKVKDQWLLSEKRLDAELLNELSYILGNLPMPPTSLKILCRNKRAPNVIYALHWFF